MSDETTDYWMNRGALCNCDKCRIERLEKQVAQLAALIKAQADDGK